MTESGLRRAHLYPCRFRDLCPFVSYCASATALISQVFWEVSGRLETIGNGRQARASAGNRRNEHR